MKRLMEQPTAVKIINMFKEFWYLSQVKPKKELRSKLLMMTTGNPTKHSFANFLGNDAVFCGGSGVLYQILVQNDFSKRRVSYRFKAEEFRNWRAFEFFQLLKNNIK